MSRSIPRTIGPPTVLLCPSREPRCARGALVRILLVSLTFSLCPPGLDAQTNQGWFPFVQPWNDTLRDSPRMRFFPVFPTETAGSRGFLAVDPDGHFRFGNGPDPARFVGVNFSFGASTADSAVIMLVARRLAKYGINVVRMHHMDNHAWWDNRETLLDLPDRHSATRRLNPAQLRRLSWTIRALADQGIYSNINLHVSRSFQAADGVANADSLPDFGKAVSMFDPRIRWLMKEYAASLLNTVNPYTGLRYADDPRIAFVEISNENSLYTAWLWGALNFVPGSAGTISLHHSRMLDSIWTAWLRGRYRDTDELREAWKPEAAADTVNSVRNGGFEVPAGTEWTLEVHTPDGAAASFQRVSDAGAGSASARIDVTAATGTGWHVQFKQAGIIPLESDSQYTVSFLAKASHPRPCFVSMMKNEAGYENYGLSHRFDLPTQWTTCSVSFRCRATDSATTRLSFSLGDDTGSVWLDEIRLTGLVQTGLTDDEGLEAGTVRRVAGNVGLDVTTARLRETAAFMISLQKDFFDDIRAYLRDSVGVRCPIAGSNWYSGLGDLSSQLGMDYIDNHAYWQHPQFPNVPWDPADWLIPNTAMTSDTGLGTMPRLAAYAVADKPYVVSEYNHPAPNRFQSEMLLHFPAYASLQSWDAIYLYSYHHGHDGWDHQKINGFFDVDGNPLALCLLPQAAGIFRRNSVQAASREIRLRFSREDILRETVLEHGALFFSGLSDALPLLYRVRTADFDAPRTPSAREYLIPDISQPYLSETQEIRWDPHGTLLTLDAPSAQGCTGLMPNTPVSTRDMTISGDGSFTTLLCTSVDGTTLGQPGRALLTVLGRAENSGMTWDGNTTVHDRWGTTPPLLQPRPITVTFSCCDSIRVYPLDSLGQSSSFTTYGRNGIGEVSVPIDPSIHRTPWYGIERVIMSDVAGDSVPESTAVRIFPNPADAMLSAQLSFPRHTPIRLGLYDLLGRHVAGLDLRVAQGESRNVRIPVADLPAGLYVLRVLTEKEVFSRSVMVLHR